MIDRMIETSYYEENIINGINDCNKRFLIRMLCMIDTLESNEYNNIMAINVMIENSHYSFVDKYKRLCECKYKQYDIKEYSRYKKREKG